jgi:hypothetical protein
MAVPIAFSLIFELQPMSAMALKKATYFIILLPLGHLSCAAGIWDAYFFYPYDSGYLELHEPCKEESRKFSCEQVFVWCIPLEKFIL